MLQDLTVKQFIEKTASSAATPGGGSIAAESGATAYALAEMVARLSLNKKEYKDYRAQFEEIIEITSHLRDELLEDIDNDANSYNEVVRAKKLPRSTPEEISYRKVQMDESYQYAAGMQLSVAEKILEQMHIFDFLAENGYKLAVTDVVVGLMMARTAVLSALLNTKCNLECIEDKSFVKEMMERVKQMSKHVRTFEMKLLEEHL